MFLNTQRTYNFKYNNFYGIKTVKLYFWTLKEHFSFIMSSRTVKILVLACANKNDEKTENLRPEEP